MDEYHNLEQELVRKTEQRMSELVERLHKMEEETDELRNQVQEERRQAFTDALTGLPNRFAYEERLEQEYARWQRYQSPLSVMIVDVDHFKRINDTYGHQAGDKALRIIARELAMAIRKTDFIGRYGGEEIVILMPETPADAALVAADKLRQRIEKCGFHFRDKKVAGRSGALCSQETGTQPLRERMTTPMARNRQLKKTASEPIPGRGMSPQYAFLHFNNRQQRTAFRTGGS